MVRIIFISFLAIIQLSTLKGNILKKQEKIRYYFLKNYSLRQNKAAIYYYDKLSKKTKQDTLKYLKLLSRERLVKDYNSTLISYIDKTKFIDFDELNPILSDSISHNREFLIKKIQYKNYRYKCSLKDTLTSKILDFIWFEDQMIRKKFTEEIEKNGYSNYFLKLNDSMRIIDSINLSRIIQLKVFDGLDISESSIGIKGIETIFLVVQHSGNIEQRKYLLRNCKDLDVYQFMMLSDRISYMETNKQIYGTQYDAENKLIPLINIKYANCYRLKNNLITINHLIELNSL